MRYLKIFLATLGMVVGVIGAGLGGMALQGRFSQEKIGPDSVHFSDDKFFVDSDFELTIAASNELVTEKRITLSFSTTGNVTEFDGRISDGTVIVPKFVEVGTSFKVELAKHNISIDGEIFPWIRGGVSNLVATSEDKLASFDTAQVFVDVPVHSLVLETSALLNSDTQSEFDVNSSFFAKASFRPESSAFKYSQNGENGLELEYKSVFFNSLEDSFIKMKEVAQSTFGLHSAGFDAFEQKEKVLISAFAFVSAKDEEEAFGQVPKQFELKERYNELLSKFLREDVSSVESGIEVDISPLVVGDFSVNTLDIEIKFNQPITIFVNKAADGLVDSLNLNAQVLASDGVAKMTSHFQNIGLALMINGTAATDKDFDVDGGKKIVSEINGVEYNFFLPRANSDNPGDSRWEITALKQNLDAQMIVVLFNDDESINLSSFVDKDETKEIKNKIYVSAKGIVQDRVYWLNYFNFVKTLYIEKSEIGDAFSSYNFASPNFDGATAYVSPNNTYTDVKYFAYLFQISANEIVDQTQDGWKVSDFVNAKDVATRYNTGTDTINIYEILDGNLMPKAQELPDDYVIRVIFGTLETDENKRPTIDENGGYVIDKISRDENNNLQTLSFDIKEVMESLSAELVFDLESAVYDIDSKTVAVVHRQDNAFKVEFKVSAEQKEIFVRDFNEGKIDVRFLINGQVAEGFLYAQPIFEVGNDSFEIDVDIREIALSSAGFEHFEVELRYIKGDVFSGVQETFKVATIRLTNNDTIDNENGEDETIEFPSTVENATLEVYDGLIATLKFAGDDLDQVTLDNPINVSTALEIASTNNTTGIRLPSTDSTNSFTHTIADIENEIFVTETKNLKVKAYDKYGKEIEYTNNMWRLVSSDTSIISVTGMSLNFIKNTLEPVKIHVETESFAVGGTSLVSANSLFFAVEASGRVVNVDKNNGEGAYENVWKHSDFDIYEKTPDNNFEIDDIESDAYTGDKIEVNIKGKAAAYNLTLTNSTNLIKVLYAMPASGGGNLYNVFDLVTITKFYLNSNIEIFDNFIRFNYVVGSNNELESFQILKNFGRNAELEFIAQTEIGLTFKVVVNIEAEINAKLNDNFDHKNKGASEVTESGLKYYGVFAEHIIELEITDFSVPLNNYKPLIYDFDTKKVLAILDETIDGSMIEIDGNSLKITLYLKDVDKNTLRNLIFVLHSDKTTGSVDENNYSRNINDYSIETLRFYVNPNTEINIKTGSNLDMTPIENQSGAEIGVRIKLSSNKIENFVVAEDDTPVDGGVFYAVGKVDRRNDNLLKTTASLPYINAYLTNASGTARITHDYIKLENNTLSITKEFNNKITVYVMLEHIVEFNDAMPVSQLIGYYQIDLVPNIAENNNNQNFVTYDGTRYLQLVSKKGQDSSQKHDEETTNAIYEFAALVNMFVDGNSKESTNISVVFDTNITQNSRWKIDAQNITLYQSADVRVGDLNIIVTLSGVGSVEFPVILLPLKAPFVIYNTETTFEDDENLIERNSLANQDLIYSIGRVGIAGTEKYKKLYENNVYNLVSDSQQDLNFFKTVDSTTHFGLNFTEEESGDLALYYLLLDDPTSSIPSSRAANINNSTGELTTFQLGEDAFVIVLVRYSGFEMFYRLKIDATSEMRAHYPYLDEDAEYIFHNGKGTVSIDFASKFEEIIPATKQEIENVYEYDAEENEYIPATVFPTSRFGLFRKIEIEDENEGFEQLVLNIKSVNIIGVTANDNAIDSSQWAVYVRQDQQNLLRYVFNQSGVSYTVRFEVENDLFAKTTYTVVVGATSPNFAVVEDDETENIATMQELSQDYIFELDSPSAGETGTSDELEKLRLRESLGGGVVRDQTAELRYHIFEDYKNILSIDEDNQIVAKYTPNTIRAKILLYTKYGAVATYEVVVNSKIYVADKDDNETKKTSHTMKSGEVFDLSEVVAFVEKDTLTKFDASNWKISFKNLEQGQILPNFVVGDDESTSAFYIMPIESDKTLEMSVEVTLDSGPESESIFEFDFALTVEKNIISKYKNSTVAGEHPEDVFAGEELELELFVSFFTSKNIEIKINENGEIVGKNLNEEFNNTWFEYKIEITAENAADLVKVKDVVDNAIVFETMPSAYENIIVLKAVVIFEKTISENNVYLVSFESYYSFKLLPDSEVEAYYPIVNGETHTSEKIVYSVDTSIKLDEPNIFRSENRVKITPSGSWEMDDLQVEIKARHIAGEKDKLLLNGNALDSAVTYYYNEQFNFSFSSETVIGYSEVALDVFVNGILRVTYRIDVYSEISSVYLLKINHINLVEEDNREVFYLGQDKENIFYGVQAIKFVVDQNFKDNVKLEVFKQKDTTITNLEMSIDLKQIDASFSKTITPSTTTDLKELSDLNTSNIRFRVTRNGVDSGLKTLEQMRAEHIFAIDGRDDIELIRRLEITYLGETITNEKFLESIVLTEGESGNPFNSETFKIARKELGKPPIIEDEKDVFINSYNGNVRVYFGSSNENNSLGTYHYKYKINFEVGASEYEIYAGDTVNRILEAFEIKKATGDKFVVYGETTQVDEILKNGKASIEFFFETRTNVAGHEEIDYRYADTTQIYNLKTALAPITIGNTGDYDFTIIAHASNNNGILVTGIIRYTYKVDDDAANNIVFESKIAIIVKHSWQVNSTNRYAQGENSIQNPEVISADNFNEAAFLSYVLIDDRGANINRGIDVRKQNGIDQKNYAIGFNLTFEIQDFATEIDSIIEGEAVVAKQIAIYKPSFAERNFTVTAEDAYGFKVVLYFKIEPTDVIFYTGGLHDGGKIFEGDSFLIRHSGNEKTEHLITLNKTDLSSNLNVKFELFNDSSKQPLGESITTDFATLEQEQKFNFLDSQTFSDTLGNVRVYLQITLKQEYEEYIINTEAFYLYQRYATNLFSTKVSDGLKTDLGNHISVTDKKYNSQLGVPILLNDKTLVIEDTEFYGGVMVEGYNNLNHTDSQYISVEKPEEKITRYISMETHFGAEFKDLKDFSFRIVRIEDQNKDITISYTNESNVSVTATKPEESGKKFLVRVGNSEGVEDFVITEGTSKTTEGNKLGILGYEEYSEDTFKLGLETSGENNETLDLKLQLPANIESYKIVLTNYGTTNAQNIKTINVYGEGNDLYHLKTITSGINPTIKQKDSQTLVGGKIDLSLYTTSGADWVILKYNYKVGNVQKNHDEFNFVADKKLTIGTTIKNGHSVTIHFNGVNRSINVPLNISGKQEFSLFETAMKGENGWKSYTKENFDASGIELRSSEPISYEDIQAIKDMTYYNDTIEFKLGAVQGTGNINFVLQKQRADGAIFRKDFIIQTSTYAKTFTVGLSHAFKDLDGKTTAIGDYYTLELLTIPDTATINEFRVIWPDGTTEKLDGKLTIGADFSKLNFGSYSFNESAEIANGKTTIEIDSEGLYNAHYNQSYNIKEVPVTKFYLVEFNEVIHYVEPVNYQVSPYYKGIDTSTVYGSNALRVISEYSQQKLEDDKVEYIVQFESWAGDIPLLDAHGNHRKVGEKTLYLSDAYKEDNPIVKFNLDTNISSGGGNIDENNGNLFVTLSSEEQIESRHFVIDVLVALNGKLAEDDESETQWLKMGTITIGFNAHSQFFLEAGNYVVSTVNSSETFVKYIEIDKESGPTTFSVSRLFQDSSVELSPTSVFEAENGLDTVYLQNKEESYYQVSYTDKSFEINTVIESEKLQKPVIIGNNILNDAITFELKIGGETYRGSYIHNEQTALFGPISLEDIKTDSNIPFETLISGEEDIEINVLGENPKAQVFWSKVDLTSITEKGLKFFGDNAEGENGKDTNFSPIISTSTTFKISKISASNIEQVKVTVAGNSTEYYAITQIVQVGTVTKNVQTVVYKVENDSQNRETKPINLAKMLGTSLFTNLVIVEKIDRISGIKGPVLFNTDGNYYQYEVGKLSNNTMTTDITVIKKGFNGLRTDDLSYTFVIDGLLTTTYEGMKAIIVAKSLEAGQEQPDDSLNLEINFTPAGNQDYNLITTGQRLLYQNIETYYTYEYVTTGRTELNFKDGETKFFIKADSGKLTWHELIDGSETGNIYYNKKDSANSQTTHKIAITEISGLSDKDVISDIWDGRIYVENADQIEIGIVTYTASNNEDKEMFFKVAEFADSGNYINLGKLFESIDGGKINKLNFVTNQSEAIITEHTSLTDYFESIEEVSYSIKEGEVSHGLIRVQVGNTYTIFDLIDDDDRTSVLKDVIKLESASTEWILPNGFYLFSYKDEVEMVEITNGAYNLFNLYGNLLKASFLDDFEITGINTQLIVDTTAETSTLINLKIVDTNDENNFKIITTHTLAEDETQVAVIWLDDHSEFLMNLKEAKVVVYQVDNDGNEIEDGIVENGIEIDIKQS